MILEAYFMIGMHLYFEYPDPQVHQAVVSLQSYNSFRNVFCFRDAFKYIVQMYPTANMFGSRSHEVGLKVEIRLELDGKWVTRNGQDIARFQRPSEKKSSSQTCMSFAKQTERVNQA